MASRKVCLCSVHDDRNRLQSFAIYIGSIFMAGDDIDGRDIL